MKRIFYVTAALALIVFTWSIPSGATPQDRGLMVSEMEQEKRIALVIGNGAYDTAPLRNPVNDAEDMAAALTMCGFTVIKKINADQQGMENAVRDFGNRIKGGGVGLFYYAGHGMQINGRNYLIPVKTDVQSEDEVKYKSVDAGFVLDKMHTAGNRINIVILDACRNNPFERSFRSSTSGLARMDAPRGSIVAYATDPGSVAADGTGKNGLYTEALLKYITVPGLKVEEVFKRVRDEVMRGSADAQVPWELSSLRGDFYFSLPGHATVSRADEISLPGGASVDLGDFEKRRQARMDGEKRWSAWQQERKTDYERLQQYDQDTYLTRDEKIAAWQTFSEAMTDDNPFSTEDDEMRRYARQRIDHWLQWRPTPIPTPRVTTPSPAVASSRYIDNGDGTVTDTQTGLMWAKNDSWNDTGTCMDWNAAKQFMSRLRTGGHSDWRLPTIDELKSIFDKTNPTMNCGSGFNIYLPSVFPSGGAGWFWSSEEDGSCCARGMGFNDGSVYGGNRDGCSGLGVRAVRRR